eukprot:10471251-Ditylum_brightwellii.AAC.2
MRFKEEINNWYGLEWTVTNLAPSVDFMDLTTRETERQTHRERESESERAREKEKEKEQETYQRVHLALTF